MTGTKTGEKSQSSTIEPEKSWEEPLAARRSWLPVRTYLQYPVVSDYAKTGRKQMRRLPI